MRTFGRKLVATPLLIAIALMAAGIPATAREVHRQNSAQSCCHARDCTAVERTGRPGRDTGRARCARAARDMDNIESCQEVPVRGMHAACEAFGETQCEEEPGSSPDR